MLTESTLPSKDVSEEDQKAFKEYKRRYDETMKLLDTELKAIILEKDCLSKSTLDAVRIFEILLVAEYRHDNQTQREYFDEDHEKTTRDVEEKREIVSKSMENDCQLLLKFHRNFGSTSFSPVCNFLKGFEDKVLNKMVQSSFQDLGMQRNQILFESLLASLEAIQFLPTNIQENVVEMRTIYAQHYDQTECKGIFVCIFSLFAMQLQDDPEAINKWGRSFLGGYRILFKRMDKSVWQHDDLIALNAVWEKAFKLAEKYKCFSDLLTQLILLKRQIINKYRYSLLQYSSFESDAVQSAFDNELFRAAASFENIVSSEEDDLHHRLQSNLDFMLRIQQAFRILLGNFKITPKNISEKLRTCIREEFNIYLLTLTENLNLPEFDEARRLQSYIQLLISTNLNRSAGFVKLVSVMLLSAPQNNFDRDFSERVLMNQLSSKRNVQIGDTDWDNFVAYVIEAYTNDNWNFTTLKNKLLQRLMPQQLDSSCNMSLLCLTESEQEYLDFILSFHSTLNFTEIDVEIHKIFLDSFTSQWKCQLKNLLLKLIFSYLLKAYNFNCCEMISTIADQLTQQQQDELKADLSAFLLRSSGQEIIRISVLSRIDSFESTSIEGAKKLSNFKLNISRITDLQCAFSHSIFIAEERESGREWFLWMKYLLRGLTINRIAFDDLRDILRYTIDTPVRILIEVAKTRLLQNWLEEICLQRVVRNVRQLATNELPIANHENMLGSFKKDLQRLPKNPVKINLFKILAAKFSQETRLLNQKTVVQLSSIKDFGKQLSHTNISSSILERLSKQPISQWKTLLREQQLMAAWPAEAVPYIIKLEKTKPGSLVDDFLAKFSKVTKELLPESTTNFLCKIISSQWILDSKLLDSVSQLPNAC